MTTAATPTYDFSDKKVVEKLIERRHPEFGELEDHWCFCGESYEGGRKWINKKNVFKFYKEGEKEYKERLKRTYRANHTKRVVETINEYLFKQRPARDASTPELIRDFWKDCDRKKSSNDDFVRGLERLESVYGRLYIVVDRPAEVANSRAEEKLPYLYVVKPTHMLDMGFDNEGNFTWVLIGEDYRDDSSPLTSGKTLMRYRLWTRDEWYLFAPSDPEKPDKIEWLGLGEGYGHHGLGVVPVIPHGSREGSPYSAPAMISDIAYMDRTLVNYGALLDEILYEQTFSQMIMPATGILPGTKESNQLIASAKNRVFLYNGDSTNKPEFISPDASQAKLLIDASDRLARAIYAVTGTDNDANSQSMSTGKSYASGTVRSFDHAQIENMLLSKARALELTEDRIMRLVFTWMNDKEQEIEKNWVRYPSTFDIRGLQADLGIGYELYRQTAPQIVMREHMKVTAEKLFPRKSPEEMATINEEIDGWEPMFVAEHQLADRQVTVSEDQNDIAREQMDQDAELEREKIKAQKETAKATAKAAAKKPPPAKKAA